MKSLFLTEEANRCLLCKKPRCKEACPINTSIPEVISLYREDKFEEAGKMLFENNPLSAVCAIVCPHEEQCAGSCIRGIKGEPIHFYEIEEEVSGKYLETLNLKKGQGNRDRIAIVGGGPAGITIAFILAQKGFKVTIFEAHEKIGGVLRYGIPEYRLPNSMIDSISNKLVQLGVQIRPNIMIGPVITLDRLIEDAYKAVFIGTGVWNAKKLNIKGETLGNVHYAIDYLKAPEVYNLGKTVCVIGAGNVAMDAARVAKRSGAEHVYVVYRKGFEQMTATNKEIEEAKEDGVEFDLFKAPIEILEDGIKVVKTENIEVDGKIQTKMLDEESFIKCDTTIIAISQEPRNTIASRDKELETNKWGLVVTDEEGRTTKKGVFASGDVVTGAKTVVHAVNHAKTVANAIEKYCEEN
ncbi:NAD(P)-dependent oxidoreductase [Clostridium thermobutyricum]|uniref:Glutamate synthase [NADPH] small chain n=1 Tax=Clostridium thermobutyricum DSM 4928 TaxID=1121339 RepID=A0A1V4SU87_9CLOT|nr:NAD(P)-dependent oxidoreductase [Clostridium thermobutyricum]OPX47036.1 glutamate synthase [NADPH] small chain [Clostridium thermobutyricum DSM 4928]